MNPELGLQRSFPRLQFSPPASAGLPQPVHPRPRARLSEAPPSRAGTPSWRSRDFNSTTSPPRAGTVGLRFHRAAQGGGPLPPSLARRVPAASARAAERTDEGLTAASGGRARAAQDGPVRSARGPGGCTQSLDAPGPVAGPPLQGSLRSQLSRSAASALLKGSERPSEGKARWFCRKTSHALPHGPDPARSHEGTRRPLPAAHTWARRAEPGPTFTPLTPTTGPPKAPLRPRRARS